MTDVDDCARWWDSLDQDERFVHLYQSGVVEIQFCSSMLSGQAYASLGSGVQSFVKDAYKQKAAPKKAAKAAPAMAMPEAHKVEGTL